MGRSDNESNYCRAKRLAISPATYPPLKPASIFTHETFDAQQVSIDSIAVIPCSEAP